MMRYGSSSSWCYRLRKVDKFDRKHEKAKVTIWPAIAKIMVRLTKASELDLNKKYARAPPINKMIGVNIRERPAAVTARFL